MCKFWSCLVTRQGKVVWNGNINSHAELITKAGLKDDKLVDRDFVKIEITPVKELTVSRKNWVLRVDDEGTLPEWFERQRTHYENLCYTTLFKHLKECHYPEAQKWWKKMTKRKCAGVVQDKNKKTRLTYSEFERKMLNSCVGAHNRHCKGKVVRDWECVGGGIGYDIVARCDTCAWECRVTDFTRW